MQNIAHFIRNVVLTPAAAQIFVIFLNPSIFVIALRRARRRKRRRRRSHGGFWPVTIYFCQQDARAVSSGRGPNIPRNHINILSLLSIELHNEWRAKSSNAEKKNRVGLQTRKSVFANVSLFFFNILFVKEMFLSTLVIFFF